MKLTTIILFAVLIGIVLISLWLWTPDKQRSVLERDYLLSQNGMLKIDDALLHVHMDGPREAPVVIMLHGFGASLHTWIPWASALSHDYRVILFDLPGSGLSLPDPSNDYSDTRSIELVLQLMDDQGIQKATLIGHSIGGRIAWRSAANHPERFEKLVLIAPDGFASPGFEYGKSPELPMIMSLMRYALPRSLLRLNAKQSYGDPANLKEETVDRYYDLILAPGARQALLERLRQTILSDPRPVLKNINIPVLLVWGEKDALIPFSNAKDYLEYLPSARLESFSELGHVPHEESPEKTLPFITEFLSE